MLYDLDYTDPEDLQPLFFRAVLRDGVLEVPARDSGEVLG
jgi:CRISPR-associated protein Cas5d